MNLLVLDFDGTMTDAEVEGAPFTAGYLDDLAVLVGRAPGDPEIRAICDAAVARIVVDPEAAFEWMGKKVAPTRVDPYLRIVPVAHAILDHFGAFPRPEDRSALLGRVLYKYNYAKTTIAPRPGARDLLVSLTGRDVWVVTNSYTEHVQKKIEVIDGGTGELSWLVPRVRGDASKFEVDDAWLGAPPSLALPGLARPVLLRRRKYFEALSELLDGRPFGALTVIGDIFELDLAMPMELGARVGLVAGPHTPGHEIAYVSKHPRGAVLEGLDAVRDFADRGA